MNMDSDIEHIVRQLYHKNILDSSELQVETMNGTTEGRIYALTDHKNTYVLKLDDPQQIKSTSQFLQTYHRCTLLPKVLYVEPEYSYLVYSYIKGTTHYNRGSKIKWLTILVKELFNHYQADQSPVWGRLEFPRRSWYEFNDISVEETKHNVGGLLSVDDYRLVKRLTKKLFDTEGQEDKYLLHGDTGVHNFVFDQFALVGVIDPSPMTGPLIYDFLYAFCSSPDDLNRETLFAAYRMLEHQPVSNARLVEETAVQLYCRIGICVRHHPHDLADYLKAWDYWKELLQHGPNLDSQ